MKSNFSTALVGFAVGLVVAAAGAQAAAQATGHDHAEPSAQKPVAPAEGMKDMRAMMADPAMRQKMSANMTQCRDMMSMMMEHMKHEGKAVDGAGGQPKH
jgi:hypothetical protein